MPPFALKECRLNNADSKGSVLMEFALVLPFIFLLFIGSVEFSRGLRVKEMMSALGREAASQSFRQCGADESNNVCTPNFSTADACLTRVQVQSFGLAQLVLSNSVPLRLSLSLYRYDADSDTIFSIGRSRDALGAVGESKFNTQAIRDQYYSLIKTHRIIAISEVYYDFSPLFSGGWLKGSTFYDATIY